MKNTRQELEDAQTLKLEASSGRQIQAPARFFIPKAHWPTEEYGEPKAENSGKEQLPGEENETEGYYVSGLTSQLEGKPHHYRVTDHRGTNLVKSTELETGENMLHADQLEDKRAEVQSLMNERIKKEKKATIDVSAVTHTTEGLLSIIKKMSGGSQGKGAGTDDADELRDEEKEEDEQSEDEDEPDSEEEEKQTARSVLMKAVGIGGTSAAKGGGSTPRGGGGGGGGGGGSGGGGGGGRAGGGSNKSAVPSAKTTTAKGDKAVKTELVQLDGRGRRLKESVRKDLDTLMDNVETLFTEGGKDFNEGFLWNWRNEDDDTDDEDEKEGEEGSAKYDNFQKWLKGVIKAVPGYASSAKTNAGRIEKSPNKEGLDAELREAQSIKETLDAALKLAKMMLLKHQPPQEYLHAMRACKKELALPLPFFTTQLKSKMSKLQMFSHHAELKAMFTRGEGKDEIQELICEDNRPYYNKKDDTAWLEKQYKEMTQHFVENNVLMLAKEIPSKEASAGKGAALAKSANMVKQFVDISKDKDSFIPEAFALGDLLLSSMILNFRTEPTEAVGQHLDKLYGMDKDSLTPLQRFFLEHPVGKMLVGNAEANLEERKGETELADKCKECEESIEHVLCIPSEGRIGMLSTGFQDEFVELVVTTKEDISSFNELIGSKTKKKQISAAVKQTMMEKQKKLEGDLEQALLETLGDGSKNTFCDVMEWTLRFIMSKSLTIERGGETGTLCEVDIDTKLAIVADPPPGTQVLLSTESQEMLEADVKTLKRVTLLLKAGLKLFIGEHSDTQPMFSDKERSAIDQARSLGTHLEKNQFVDVSDGAVGANSKAEFDFLVDYVEKANKKALAKFSTQIEDVVDKHMLEADPLRQPDERELNALKGLIGTSNLEPSVVESMHQILDLRVDMHTQACMKQATASTILGRMLGGAGAIKAAAPKIVEAGLLKEEKQKALTDKMDNIVLATAEIAGDRMQVFEDRIEAALKPALRYIDCCPQVSQEKDFMDYMLKKKSDADKAVLLQKEIEKAAEQYELESKAFPENLQHVWEEQDQYITAKKTAVKIQGILQKLAMLTILRNPTTTTTQGATYRRDLQGILATVADMVKKGHKDELDIPEEFLTEAQNVAKWTVAKKAAAKPGAKAGAKAGADAAPKSQAGAAEKRAAKARAAPEEAAPEGEAGAGAAAAEAASTETPRGLLRTPQRKAEAAANAAEARMAATEGVADAAKAAAAAVEPPKKKGRGKGKAGTASDEAAGDDTQASRSSKRRRS